MINKLIAHIIDLKLKTYNFYITEDEKEIEEIYKIRYKVYCEELNFISSSKFPNKMEKDEFDDYSVFFVVKYKEKIIGTARIVLGNKGKIPTEACLDIRKKLLKTDKIAEISRFVILPEFRSNKIALGLIKEIILYAFSNDLEYYVITNSVPHSERYKKFGFKIINGPYKFKPINDKYLAVTMVNNINESKLKFKNIFPLFYYFLKIK